LGDVPTRVTDRAIEREQVPRFGELSLGGEEALEDRVDPLLVVGRIWARGRPG